MPMLPLKKQIIIHFVWIWITLIELNSAHFGYSEASQRRWFKRYQNCAGKNQSPIAVTTSKAIALHMPAIEMIGYHNFLPYPLKIVNNGHTASLNIPKLTEQEIANGAFLPYIRGGKLTNEYELEGLHFHWGDKNNRGSEHVIDDIRYPLEMHIIHRNKKYTTMSDALNQSDGVTVLGFFFTLNVNDEYDLDLATISRHLSLVQNTYDKIQMNVTFTLSSLINSVDLDRFFMYKGSLTTPPCSEAVTWALYPDAIPISRKQISHFRELQDDSDDSIVDNFRSLQPIGKRRVFLRVGNPRHIPVKYLEREISYTEWDWFNQ